MILLDTSVLSELMRPYPSPAVESWLGNRPAGSLFFSAVGEAELRFGLALMPAGRRKDALTAEIEAMLRDDFAGRVLPFDRDAASGVCGHRRQSPFRRSADRGGRLPDCGDCPGPRHGVGDPEFKGFRGYRH